MLAYKFLAGDCIGRFSGFRWEPRSWVEVDGAVDVCRTGIHACRADQLPFWLDDELWTIELKDVVELHGVLVARRGRLDARVPAWDGEASREFALSCVERIREWAAGDAGATTLEEYREDAGAAAEAVSSAENAALVGFIAAQAAEVAEPGCGQAERARQASWLRDRLDL
jgi:hypothetical protein